MTANYRIIDLDIDASILPIHADMNTSAGWRTFAYCSNVKAAAESIVQRINDGCVGRLATADELAELKHWEELL